MIESDKILREFMKHDPELAEQLLKSTILIQPLLSNMMQRIMDLEEPPYQPPHLTEAELIELAENES